MATKNLIAHAAHNKVYRAIRSGKLEHPYMMECIECGWSPCEYHHPRYDRPLKVIPLCRWCHQRKHRKNRSKATHIMGIRMQLQGRDKLGRFLSTERRAKK